MTHATVAPAVTETHGVAPPPAAVKAGGPATPAPVSTVEENTLVGRARQEVAEGVEQGLGALGALLGPPSIARTETPTRTEPDRKARTPKRRPAGAPKTASTTATPSEPCEVKTYGWGSLRVPISGDGDRRFVKFKNGHWENPDNQCHMIHSIGPGFGDLDRDGTQEAYVVVSEIEASENLEGTCSFGMGVGSEVLMAFALDDRCKVQKRGEIAVRDCEYGPCDDLDLRVGEDRVLYGRHRFKWVGGKLRPAR